MKQPLWILNLSLVFIFVAMLLINLMLKQEPPPLRRKSISMEEIQKKKIAPIINLEKIYKQDIFDTFTPIEKKPEKQDFVTPVPQPKAPVILPPPDPVKMELVPALNITLKGIISSLDETKGVAMIADETNKEKIYHLSNKIKDGQILKITRNKIVILRANGQQETFFLRKEGLEQEHPAEDIKWLRAIKKIDDQNYEVDPTNFAKEVESLGALIEELKLRASYQKGNPVGIKVGKLDVNSLGQILGLNENDILVSINDLNTIDLKNRIKLYDTLYASKEGDNIKLVLKRNDQETIFNYKIKKIEKTKDQFFMQSDEEKESGEFKMSSQQEREKHLREFKQTHRSPKQQNVISDVRRRLLDNMRTRGRNRRVR